MTSRAEQNIRVAIRILDAEVEEVVALAPKAPPLPDGVAEQLLPLLEGGPVIVADLAEAYRGPGSTRQGRSLVDLLWVWLLELQRQGRVTSGFEGSPPVLHWQLPSGRNSCPANAARTERKES